MSDNTAKINLKIGQIEISIEGPSDFVSQQYDKVEAHLKTYSEMSSKIVVPKVQASATESGNDNTGSHSSNGNGDLPSSFGEWLNLVPKETSDTDKAILAGYFIQLNSEKKTFRTRDVTKLLKEHSISLSNPSVFLKTSIETKKIFQVSKTGNEANFRLTRESEDAMKVLLKK
jgi:hypothetical protein